MDVAADHPLVDCDERAPAQIDVLADHRDRLGDLIGNAPPGPGHRLS
jgi:hypothetical protein